MALDARAFTAFESSAHDRIAGRYAKHFAPLTGLALGPLLDAARVAAGRRVLDVATGPGVAAAAALGRGAAVTGLDVSPGMVALAQQAHPGATFRVGDVVALPFPDGAFDAVLGNFALGHFPEPEAALVECVRVLVPGGVLAFSWWDRPERQRVQGLFREVIAELGLPPHPDVPQGHDTLRFSEPEAFARLLRGAGLGGVDVAAHRTTHALPDVEALWRAGMGGMAVTASAIAVQDAATQARARDVLARRAEVYRGPRGLDIPIAYFIGTGRKS
ncbi:methyltransferase domain-containing protein [Belnapia sp. T6]|uniref:Methyltransferase domain-containing protein n=1 Tax=Belnapia mucosa TaxID=2804532 RepID=A0ABS1UZI8_9PROT|nr:methyltransferase domain-containing protein [Belnapia mucosa]MBL6454873.1 methyltransferase domain-containing protein [Belnapia mucosa]